MTALLSCLVKRPLESFEAARADLLAETITHFKPLNYSEIPTFKKVLVDQLRLLEVSQNANAEITFRNSLTGYCNNMGILRDCQIITPIAETFSLCYFELWQRCLGDIANKCEQDVASKK